MMIGKINRISIFLKAMIYASTILSTGFFNARKHVQNHINAIALDEIERLRKTGQLTPETEKACHRIAEFKYHLVSPNSKGVVNISDLDYSPISSGIFEFGQPASGVEELSAGSISIDFNGFKILMSLFPCLKTLGIPGNYKITETIPENENIDFGESKKTLQTLIMSNIGFNYKWFKAICELENLKTLMIAWDIQSGVYKIPENDEIDGFGNLNNTLEVLWLNAHNIDIKMFERICKLQKLKTLKILHPCPNTCTLNFNRFCFGNLYQLKSIELIDLPFGDLDYEIAKKIKDHLPKTCTVWTGPNRI